MSHEYAKKQSFVDEILIYAKGNLTDAEFTPILAAKLTTGKDTLYKRFSNKPLTEDDEEYAISRFLSCASLLEFQEKHHC